MKVSIELHGVLQRLAGASCIELELPAGATAADALEKIDGAAGLADKLECSACAIGDAIVPRTLPLYDGATLVLIPPVSGG